MDYKLAKLCGLQREDVHWTNAILCDVPKRDLAAARKCCQQRLSAEIAETGASTVLAVGSFGMQSACELNKRPSIMAYRGSVVTASDQMRPLSEDAGHTATVIPTIHPAFVMRLPLWEPIFDADLARAGRIERDGFVPPEKHPDRRTYIIESLEQLKELAPQLDKTVAVDVETTGLDIHTVPIVCMVLSDDKLTIVVPWSRTKNGEGYFFGQRQEEAAAFLTDVLKNRVALTHNGPAYDHTVLDRHGIHVNDWDDSLLGYHAITSIFPKRLGHVAACYIDVPPWKEWRHDIDLDVLYRYCGRDGLYTRLAWDKLRSTMDASDIRVYQADKQTADLCREISRNGFAFDVERAKEIASALSVEAARISQEAADLLGIKKINLRSPLQTHNAFFNKLGAQVCFYTDNEEDSRPSLAAEALRAYAASSNEKLSKLALLLIEHRQVSMCLGMFIKSPLARVYPDGRIRPTWYSYGTVSGRWSCRQPNLANLPKPQQDPAFKLGLVGIRSLYTVAPGRKLVAFDASQIEFRIAAYLTGDPNMIYACEQSDVHAANASLLFEWFDKLEPKSAPWKAARDLAKTSGFAVCYLAEAPTVHARLVVMGQAVSLSKVEAMLAALRSKFRVYYEWQADNLDLTIRRGYVESPILGRKRLLGHNPKAPECANFPVQAGAADVFNMKGVEIRRRLADARLDAMIVAGVYDAVYIDTAEKDVPAVCAIARDVWSQPVTISGREVVLPIDLKVGDRWSEV